MAKKKAKCRVQMLHLEKAKFNIVWPMYVCIYIYISVCVCVLNVILYIYDYMRTYLEEFGTEESN